MTIKSFVEGGIASVVAGCKTHQLDLLKVRMQLNGEATTLPAPPRPHPPALAFAFPGSHQSISLPLPPPPPRAAGLVSAGMKIVNQEGPTALFSGVSATVLRQALYSTTRMGLYNMMKQSYSDPVTGTLPLGTKIAVGLIAGGIGAAVGNPADVAMVRMQADGCLPPHLRRNYSGVGDAIKTMVRSERLGSLWRGSALTVNRAMLVTASQLATYDEIKETIMKKGLMEDGIGTHVPASVGAGVVVAVVSNPVDVVKTRVMNGEKGKYSGAVDCAVKTVRAEGVMALYKGFVPMVSRQGPFTVVLFVTLEQIRKLLKDF